MVGLVMSSSTNLSRYPKRKRAEVQYKDIEESYSDTSDAEIEMIPYKKARIVPRPLPKRKTFPFFDLPGEIRNQIYRYCLPTPTELPEAGKNEEPGIWFYQIRKRHRRSIQFLPSMDENAYSHAAHGHGIEDHLPQEDRKSKANDSRYPSVNILSVCKQIYTEAAPMLYSQNLVFACPDALFNFLATISPMSAKLVRRIELRSWSLSRTRATRGYMAMCMLAAKNVMNLESLFLNCSLGYFYPGPSWRKDQSIPAKVARKVYRDFHIWIEGAGTASGQWDKALQVIKVEPERYSSRYYYLRPSEHLEALEWKARFLDAFREELTRLVKEGL